MKTDFTATRPLCIIGLMSGTSADGIDAAVVDVWDEGAALRWELVHHEHVGWANPVRQAILTACRWDAPLRDVVALNVRVGEVLGEAARTAAERARVPLATVSAVASHGQTVWHQPDPFPVAGGWASGTMQIGEGAVIAAVTGCTVVSDFRAADMAVGGQGAPLVPFADHVMFSHPEETRAVQNLGGIANVTLLPAGADADAVIAFDTGPANLVMDALAAHVTSGRLSYDVDGAIAAGGAPDARLLAELLDDPYFAAPPPKSTGRERFGTEYSARLIGMAEARRLSAADLMATAAALTVESIAAAYRTWLLPRGPIDRVILGGGGARNPVVVNGLRARLAPSAIATHADFGVPDAAKEALAFALLAYCTLQGRASNVPSATGAARRAVLGKVSRPPV